MDKLVDQKPARVLFLVKNATAPGFLGIQFKTALLERGECIRCKRVRRWSRTLSASWVFHITLKITGT
jgi:hypothetical protein